MKQYYRIEVIGHLWSGPQAGYSKSFNAIPANLKSEFGDFESISDHRITEIETSVKRLCESPLKMQMTRTETVVRDFASEESEAILAGCEA
jgi:hypothetical protein